jgi:mediator of RNA polymerase II transcription subunit 22
MAEEYRQRLDNNVEKLVENFRGLVKTAKIKDKTNTSREAFQTSIYATSLVRKDLSLSLSVSFTDCLSSITMQVQASEALLKLVSELKLSVALGDFEGMNQTVDTTTEDLAKRYASHNI